MGYLPGLLQVGGFNESIMSKQYLCECGRQAFKDPCKKLDTAVGSERPQASLGKWKCDRCGNKIKVKVVNVK